MSDKDHSLVTNKAGSVIAENLKVTLATPAGAITPSTLTAMVGIAKNEALVAGPKVQAALQSMALKSSELTATIAAKQAAVPPQDASAEITFKALVDDTRSKVLAHHATIGLTTNQPAFGSFMAQAQSHINDANEVKDSVDTMKAMSFSDLGSGISKVSDMATQGLKGAMGSLASTASAISAAGPCFDMKDMGNFGSPVGLVNKLNSVKLGNASGVNDVLSKAGVDLNRLNDPVYKNTVAQGLNTVTDPKVIETVTKQLKVSPFGKISSLGDLTDITKIANPSSLPGLSTDLAGIGSKFKDLGARFDSPASAATMINRLEIPTVPKLDASAPSLSTMVSGLNTNNWTIEKNLYGGGQMSGIPSMTNFMDIAVGGPYIEAFNAAGVTTASCNALQTGIVKTEAMFEGCGIELGTKAPNCLGTAMTFATGLHKFGADTSGSGVADVLKTMANPASKFGDSIKASIAEGRNISLMQVNNIKPLDFTPPAGADPFAGLPSAPGDNSLGSGAGILGG